MKDIKAEEVLDKRAFIPIKVEFTIESERELRDLLIMLAGRNREIYPLWECLYLLLDTTPKITQKQAKV